jgi:SAM-dependent methyltransferase
MSAGAPRVGSAVINQSCCVCGQHEFAHSDVLWPELVSAWELSEDEWRYIDIQQGTHCVACRANVRSIALARAIMRARGFTGTLTGFVADRAQAALRVLEINEAGGLHPILAQLPGHRLISHPEYDMTALPFPAGSFDLVVHSDTLEHVANPRKGLQECLRILAHDGALAFTVPVIVGRLSRDRASLPPSYHGQEGSVDPGMLVHTEFGADVWTYVLGVGFSSCELVPVAYPAGLAIIAKATTH